MANIINATTVGAGGISYTADASGVLQLQANGTTALTVGAGGLLTAANGLLMSSMTLGTATAGEFEYDGQVPYFTPLGTQRGVIPGMQYYRLNTTLVGTNATGAQNYLGVGCTLSSNTVYAFEGLFLIYKTAGTTSHTVSNGFGGTATLNNIGYHVLWNGTTSYAYSSGGSSSALTSASATVISSSRTAAGEYAFVKPRGTVSINAGGTFIPQYSLSAAPGGAYTTAAGSYFLIYPIGVAGANTSVGTWA